MQPKAAREAPQYEPEDHQVESEQPMRDGWSARSGISHLPLGER
jgi:hypothetical protein